MIKNFKHLNKINFMETHIVGTYLIKTRRFVGMNTQKKKTCTFKATLKLGTYTDGEGYHDYHHYGLYFTYKYKHKETKKFFERKTTLPDMLQEAISIQHIK